MNKINVLYLIATLDVGGAERQLVELAKRLDKKKFNPIVCCLTRGGDLLEGELKNVGIQYFILRKKFKFDFSVIFKLISILKQKNIQILHTRMFTSNSFGRIAGIFAHTPIIIALEEGIDSWKSKFRLFIDWVLSHFTDKIICVSEGVRNFYHSSAGIPLYKLVTIHGGVDINTKANIDENIKKEFGFKEDTLVITTIGRLIPSKGIKYLLYSIVEVVKKFPKIRVLIVGEGPYEKELKKLAVQLKINEYVVFTGVRKDIQSILAITDVFVFPSFSEGLPNVILEAMVSGKPVVAANIHGNDELVIDGETGLLVPPKDVDSLASAMIHLLGNPAKRKMMGIKGRERVEEHFSINETVKKTEELYETLVALKIH